MKNKLFIALLTSTLFSASVSAQAPQGIPYQAVARDNNGSLISNQSISIRFSIHDATPAGTVVYRETHNVSTNALGLFTVNVGQGAVLIGTFPAINWGTGAKFLEVELDPAGGSSYTTMGTTQMMSVPYALHAQSAGSVIEIDPQVTSTIIDRVSKWNGTSLTDGIITDNGSNIGIGTATPVRKIHAIGTESEILLQDMNDNSSIALIAPDANYTGGVGTYSNHDLPLFTNNTDRMIVKAGTGNVGIGTPTPTQSLDINGQVRIRGGAPGIDKVLTSAADGTASWTASSLLAINETDPQVSSVNNNRVAKWNGTSLIDGMITDDGSNIGIGTATPVRKIHAIGTESEILLQDMNDNSSIALIAPDANYTGGVGTYSNHDLPLFTNNTDRMIVKAGTGNVGIGTSTPSTKLEIVAPGNNIGAQILSGNVNQLTYLSVGRTTSEAQFGVATTSTFFLDASNGDMAIKSFGLTPGKILLGASYIDNSAMAIVPGNRVGIGTTSPTQSLDVNGLVRIRGGAPGVGKVLTSAADGTASWTASSLLAINETDPQVSSANNNQVAKWNGTSLTDGIITDNGNNIGIGTVNPLEKLHLSSTFTQLRLDDTDNNSTVYLSAPGSGYTGGIGTITNHDFPLFTNGLDRVTIKSGSGNVGIGTTTPLEKLEVVNNSFGGVGRFRNSNVSGFSALDFMDNGNIMKLGIGFANPSTFIGGNSYIHSIASPLLILTQSTERMRVDLNGNVGINTSTPSAKLEIVAPGNNIGAQILSGNINQLTYLSVGRTTSEAQFGIATTSTFFLDASNGDMAIKSFGLSPGKILLGASYIDNAAMAIVPGNRVGIGTVAPVYGLDVRFLSQFRSNNLVTAGVNTSNLILFSESGNQWPALAMTEGVGVGTLLFSNPTNGGGLQVCNLNSVFTPIEASAFIIGSDRRMKNNIQDISANEYNSYLTQIRAIETAKFFYNSESDRKVPHIGVISQSLPVELQAEINEKPGAGSETRIGVSLADMAGLTIVGVKALDYNQQQMQQAIAAQDQKIHELTGAVDALKAEIESLKNSNRK